MPLTLRILFTAVLLVILTSAAEAQQDIEPQKVNITVDPRIELMSTVQHLNDYFLVTRYNSLYKQDISAYFSQYKNHEAVRLFGEMSKNGFTFDAVPRAMLAHTNLPELSSQWPLSDRVLNAAGGSDSLAQFVNALKSFTQETDFQAFYQAHQGTFASIIDSTRKHVETAVGLLADYSGLPVTNGTVILGPLLHHGGFAAMYGDSVSTEVFALIGPIGTKDGLPTFGETKRIGSIIWHELSHTFVNPITSEHQNEVNQYASLFEPIKDIMHKQAYYNWEIAVNEHIIRAITTRMAYREFGDGAGNAALEDQQKRGFKYIEPLMAALETYEKNRDTYPTLVDFYPNLIKIFEELQ